MDAMICDDITYSSMISPADPEVGGIDSSLLFSHVLVARWAMRT